MSRCYYRMYAPEDLNDEILKAQEQGGLAGKLRTSQFIRHLVFLGLREYQAQREIEKTVIETVASRRKEQLQGRIMNAPSEEFRIGHRDDALALLNEMVGHCEEINAEGLPGFRGVDKAIGGISYYWPRLSALRDAVERFII